MQLASLAAYMLVGGFVATILVGVSFLFISDWWDNSLLGLLVTVAILVSIIGGAVLFVLQAIIGITREWRT